MNESALSAMARTSLARSSINLCFYPELSSSVESIGCAHKKTARERADGPRVIRLIAAA